MSEEGRRTDKRQDDKFVMEKVVVPSVPILDDDGGGEVLEDATLADLNKRDTENGGPLELIELTATANIEIPSPSSPAPGVSASD